MRELQRMVKVDAQKEIRRAVDTGKVIFGTNEAEKSLKNGTARLIIIAKNTPKLVREKLVAFAEAGKIPHHIFDGTGIELGNVCGMPFTVSAMIVENAGKSKVLDIVK